MRRGSRARVLLRLWGGGGSGEKEDRGSASAPAREGARRRRKQGNAAARANEGRGGWGPGARGQRRGRPAREEGEEEDIGAAARGWPWSFGAGCGTHRPSLVSAGGESPPRARPSHEEVRLEGWAARRGGEPLLRDGVRVWAGGSRRRGEGREEEEAILTPGVALSRRSGFCGPGRARARAQVRVAGEDGGGRGRGGQGGGESGGKESVAFTPVSRDSGSSRSACAPCVGPRPQSQPVQRERGRRVAARARWNVYGCRGSRAPSRIGNRCEVMWRARWSPEGAATGIVFLRVHIASCTRVRVRELASRACGVPARRASLTRVEGERPKV
jgi:hypothetical protein